MGWMDKIREGVEKAADAAGDAAAISRLRSDISKLHAEIQTHLDDIGDKVYDMHQDGQEFPPQITTLCKKVDSLGAQVKAKEEEIEKVKAAP